MLPMTLSLDPMVLDALGALLLVYLSITVNIGPNHQSASHSIDLTVNHITQIVFKVSNVVICSFGSFVPSYFDWTEEIDKKFIAVLEAQAQLGNMVHSKIDALFIAHEEVNDTFGTNFPLHIFRQRPYKLSNRYVVFKKITGYSGVAWDKDANVIRAFPNCWLTWIKDMPLTKAYIYQGESVWDALDVIFGKQREHQVLVNKEVIEISSDDDDDPTNGHNGLQIIVENDEDEVLTL
ncbi:hypothetical protein BUALT_Bualt04G0073500 [Buddleja alternifolia]|uniref:Myb/SANT-like domain-containing protein n=1 Tax=Buddleja alternifolia TaxID=168488 RepID=A0AAV6XND5_9LAMI|nr:hypothetical protein BUALT_Bualt04G0073500 [Buddleja alternifolia]